MILSIALIEERILGDLFGKRELVSDFIRGNKVKMAKVARKLRLKDRWKTEFGSIKIEKMPATPSEFSGRGTFEKRMLIIYIVAPIHALDMEIEFPMNRK